VLLAFRVVERIIIPGTRDPIQTANEYSARTAVLPEKPQNRNRTASRQFDSKTQELRAVPPSLYIKLEYVKYVRMLQH